MFWCPHGECLCVNSLFFCKEKFSFQLRFCSLACLISAVVVTSYILTFSVWWCECHGTPRLSHNIQLRPCSDSLNLQNKRWKIWLVNCCLNVWLSQWMTWKALFLRPSELHGIAISKKNNSSMCCGRKASTASAQKLNSQRVWLTIAANGELRRHRDTNRKWYASSNRPRNATALNLMMKKET